MAWQHDGVAVAGAGIPSGLEMQSASTAIEAPTRTIVASRDEPPARDDAREPPICADVSFMPVKVLVFQIRALRALRTGLSMDRRPPLAGGVFC
jgi:hypothetical protein